MSSSRDRIYKPSSFAAPDVEAKSWLVQCLFGKYHNNAYANVARSIQLQRSGSGRVGFGVGQPLEFKQQFLKMFGQISNHFAVA